MSSFHLRFVGAGEQAGTANECGVCGEVTNGRVLRCQQAGFTLDSNRCDLHRNRDHPIKNFHGASIAEQSLLRSVIKLRRLLRDVDTVSRVGEARFGLVLEGVTSRASVTDRAARLIAAGLMPLKGLKPEVTLQFHIAAVLLDERCVDAPELAAALSDLLKSMSPRTRRPIRFLEPEATQRMPLEGITSMMDNDSELPRADGAPGQSNA